jgi:multidrug resistance efflux pump
MSRSTDQNPWRSALDQALDQLAQAEHAFEWADAEFSDYHAYRIQAAKEQVALILRQARLAYGVIPDLQLTSGHGAIDAITAGDLAQSRH